MIRSTKINLNYANEGKLRQLDTLMDEMGRVVSLYIETLWEEQNFSSRYVSHKVETWLSARLQQCLGKQALEIAKSQRKKKKKTRPVFKGGSFTLDSRFVDFQFDNNAFDVWVRLSSLGNGLKIKLPSKRHRQFNRYVGWEMKKSVRLMRTKDKSYGLEVLFEAPMPETKRVGSTVGVDIGYKKLLVTSEGEVLDVGLEAQYEKIARKKQGSKGFRRALRERDNMVNRSLNLFDVSGVREIVCEDLKGVKEGSKGKRTKRFNNKLQRWTYPKVLGKLSRMADEGGILLTRVNPAYTSQRCSLCGVICRENRKGETYICACGNEMDADVNAAINLSHMGVYSPHA